MPDLGDCDVPCLPQIPVVGESVDEHCLEKVGYHQVKEDEDCQELSVIIWDVLQTQEVIVPRVGVEEDVGLVSEHQQEGYQENRIGCNRLSEWLGGTEAHAGDQVLE